MKETKRIFSFIIAFAMIVSCFSSVVLADSVSPMGTIIDENYGLNNYGSWTLVHAGKGDLSSTEISGDTGNYAATLAVSGDYLVGDNAEMLTLKVNGDAGIPFEAGKKIVIETRMKQSELKRYYLKMNTNPSQALGGMEYNGYFTLFGNDEGVLCSGAGLYDNGNANVDWAGGVKANQMNTSDWIKAKIELTGNGTTAPTGTITYTDVNNVTITKPVTYSANQNYWSALKTLEIRSRGSATNKVYIDYLKVSVISDITSSIERDVAADENINVVISSQASSLADVSAYYDLYEGTTLVPSQKSWDAANKKLTINPDSNLDMSKSYSVKINKAGLLSVLGYNDIAAGDSLPVTVLLCDTSAVEVKGRLIVGQTIEGDYVYSSVYDEVGSEYKWYWSETAEGAYTEIPGAPAEREITVTSDMADGRYVKFSVKPNCAWGAGIERKSKNYLAPEVAPVASGLSINSSALSVGKTFTASYTYTDANGDAENGTEIIWYSAPTAAFAERTQIGTGKNITFTEDHTGKYIRFTVTPKNAVDTTGGVTKESSVYGPVKSNFNVLVSEDYAEGDLGGWYVYDEDNTTITTEPESEGSSNYVLKFVDNTDSNSATLNSAFAVIDMPDGGIPFETGKNVVIETRLKTAQGRMLFKYNVNPGYSFLPTTSNNGFLYIPDDTAIINFRTKAGNNNYWNADESDSKTYGSSILNKWTDLKITIVGNKEKVIYEYKTEDETTWNYFEGTAAAFTNKDGVDLMGDKLKNLAIRLHGSYTGNGSNASVDYIKVTKTVDITSNIEDAISADENVVVNVNTAAASIEDISEYYDLYEGDTLVPSVKTWDGENKKITINPNAELDYAKSYSVKVKKELLLIKMNYVFTGSESLVVPVAPCKTKNVQITGRLVEGQTITGVYEYVSEFDENSSVYKWYLADSADGTYSEIPGLTTKSVTVTSEMATGKFVKFAVIPKCAEGTGTEMISSNYLTPETAPVVSNLRINRPTLYIGETFSAIYDYFDLNEDVESGSEIIWYAASNSSLTDKVEIARGKEITITEEHEGKYIYYTVVPKNNAPLLSSGAMDESSVYGPVSDILTSTNLFTNAGFETGDMTGWVANYTQSNGEPGIEAYSRDVNSGDYAMFVNSKPTGTGTWGQDVTVEPGKTYIVSGMIKSFNEPNIGYQEGYVDYKGATMNGEDRPYREEEYKTAVSNAWTRVSLTWVNRSTATSVRAGIVSFSGYQYAIIVDDMYFGELIIKDINTTNVKEIFVPDAGSTRIPIATGEIINQFGTTLGLVNERPVVEIVKGEGITLIGNDLVVTDRAVAGEIILKVSCTPTTVTATPFSKEVKINLLPNSNVVPDVSNVKITGSNNVPGTFVIGETLTVDYDFYQSEGKADASVLQWFYKDTRDAAKVYIEGANANTYTVTSALAGKYIGCEVTPVALGGGSGITVDSALIKEAAAPTALNIGYTGKMSVGETITAKYDYVDDNGDAEGTSTYQWYISGAGEENYMPISGATGKTLVITEAMVDKKLKLQVNAVSTVAPFAGEAVMSQTLLGPVAPVAKNIGISGSASMYKATYEYYHAHGIAEKETKYQWIVGGAVVSTSSTFVPNFTGSKTVTLKITPGCDGNPKYGVPVVKSFTATGISTAPGVSFGGGGGTGGGGVPTVVPPIDDMEFPEVEIPEDAYPVEKPVSDIEGHWGKEYLNNMVSRGIMSADAEGNFDPDKNLPRSEMMTYLFSAIGLEEGTYSGQFTDVSAEDEYAGALQALLDAGIISVDETFRPDDTISREEMCKILYIALKNAGKISDPAESKLSVFADAANISDWATVYVDGIYQAGIMVGVSETEFDPKGTVTKAQAATMLTRILKVMEEEVE